MHYVNIAAAIDALTYGHQCANFARQDWLESKRPASLMITERNLNEANEFLSGISYAIGTMLDPETAAIIEAAAKERAQEDN